MASWPRPGRCDLSDGPAAPSKVVVLAGSAGALPVILAQLNRLTSRSEAALFVVYHRLPNPEFQLQAFAPACASRIRPAETGEIVAENNVYHPQDGKDLEVDGERLRNVSAEARHHPNIDLLLTSLARSFGPRVTAVLLSGMATDGLRGLEAVRAAGGTVVVQSPESCRFPQLPTAAVEAGLGDMVLDLPDLHAFIDSTLGVGDEVPA